MHRLFNPCIMILIALVSSQAHAADAFQIKNEADNHADVINSDGKPILRYMYSRDTSTTDTTFDTAKVFAHVMADDGTTTLTKGAGGKFPHHRGIFIGWNKLKQGGKSHDLWHVRNTVQKHRDFVSTDTTDGSAEITALIDWIGVDGEPVLDEKRTYKVIAQNEAHALIDFTSVLTASHGDVELNGDPEHAGVQFRPSQQVAENQSAAYTFHKDGIDPKKDRDLPWVAESFQIGNDWWTVQHMSHPSNPEGARWSAYRDYGRFGPFTVVKIADGESVTFRYRFRITKGEARNRGQLQAIFDQYSK